MSLFDQPTVAVRLPREAAAIRPVPGLLAESLSRFRGDESIPRWHSDWGWQNYEALVLALAQRFGLSSLMEIGGGRDPAFTARAGAANLSVIVNDIDPAELAHLPAEIATACFDMAGDLAGRVDLAGQVDLVASRMVFEHIRDVEAAWRNTWHLLKPGGIGLAFFPTLYAWPFVINKLLPPSLAKRIVEAVFPHRRADGGAPVFPPYYDWCFGSEARLRRMLDPIGFSEVLVVPFWGHHYLDRLPVAREIDRAFNRLAARFDWRFFTSYAYVIVRK